MQYEDLVKALCESQHKAIQMIAEAQRMKDEINTEMGNNQNDYEIAMIPFGAYEMMQERFAKEEKDMREGFQAESDAFQKEKSEMRNDFKKNIRNVCIGFVSIIIALLLAFGWFLWNYDVATYEQDGNGMNNIVGNHSEQGDLDYGATAKSNQQ